VLDSGNGNFLIADLLSFPWSTAQLIYGITGVCHQTANRILFWTGLTVDHARGFWLSCLLYGYYGIDFWYWFWRWAAPVGAIAGLASLEMRNSMDEPKKDVIKLGRQEKMDVIRIGRALPEKLETRATNEDRTRKKEYLRKVTKHHEDNWKSDGKRQDVNYIDDILGGEIELTIEYRLGKPLPSNDMKKVRNHYRDFLDVKKDMEDKFNKGELAPKKYADEINKISGKVFRNWHDVLGHERCKKICGVEPPKDAFVIVQPELMENAQKQKVDSKLWEEKANELKSKGHTEASKSALDIASELGNKV
jgi:hypothetical protein